MATTRTRRRVVAVGQLGFEPQTGRENGIGDRHERFLASQRASLARFLLLLLLLLLPLLREQELCLVALRRHAVEISRHLTTTVVRSEERRRTATAAFVTLLLGERSRVRAAPNTLRSAGSTPSASSAWRLETYLGYK